MAAVDVIAEIKKLKLNIKTTGKIFYKIKESKIKRYSQTSKAFKANRVT